MNRRKLKRIGIVGLIVFLAIQFVPVSRENPSVQGEPVWDSPRTRSIAVRACFDCHSNETRWPWYSRVAPISWMLADHVRGGRESLNFSEWPAGELGDAADEVAKMEMPLREYMWLHPEARLTDEERRELVAGFKTMDEIDRRVPGRAEETESDSIGPG